VYDHLIRISDLIDSYRDLLTSAMDVYLSTVSEPAQRGDEAAGRDRHDLPAAQRRTVNVIEGRRFHESAAAWRSPAR
jgi:hypothetical protein